MPRRKNTRFIDPRYFMEEKMEGLDEAIDLRRRDKPAVQQAPSQEELLVKAQELAQADGTPYFQLPGKMKVKYWKQAQKALAQGAAPQGAAQDQEATPQGAAQDQEAAPQGATQDADLQKILQTPVGKMAQVFQNVAKQVSGDDKESFEMYANELIKYVKTGKEQNQQWILAIFEPGVLRLYKMLTAAAEKEDWDTVDKIDPLIHDTLSKLGVQANIIDRPLPKVLPFEMTFDEGDFIAGGRSEPRDDVGSDVVLRVVGWDGAGRPKVILSA